MTWFKVDDTFAFHRKVVAAGNAAIGLWTRAGAWCSQQLTDGFIPDHMVAALGTRAQARKLVDVGLWVRVEGGYQFWQWDEPGRQPTRHQVEQERAAARERMRRRRSADVRPNNTRTHSAPKPVDKSVSGETCDSVNAVSGKDLDIAPSNGDTTFEGGNQKTPQVTELRSPEHTANEQRSSAAVRQPRPVPTRPEGSVHVDQSSSGMRRAREDDDDQTDDDSTTTETGTGANAFIATIIETLRQETGRTVTPEWAARVRDQILAGRDVRRPLPYLIRALRERPRDFLPASTPTPVHDEPWMREPAPDQAEINARGRERAKAALAAARAAKTRAEESEP